MDDSVRVHPGDGIIAFREEFANGGFRFDLRHHHERIAAADAITDLVAEVPGGADGGVVEEEGAANKRRGFRSSVLLPATTKCQGRCLQVKAAVAKMMDRRFPLIGRFTHAQSILTEPTQGENGSNHQH